MKNRTIDGYLDAALAAGRFPSDRQLSLALGHNGHTVSLYRTKRAWPDDATMIRLAELAGVPVDRALLDLNIWRSKDSAVQDWYRKIAATIAAACVAFVLFGAEPAHAAVQSANIPASEAATAFIMRQSCVARSDCAGALLPLPATPKPRPA